MFPKSLRAAALAAALLPMLATAAPLTLHQAVDRAVQRSQAAHAARAGVASAAQAARAAGQLPDPMLEVGVENIPATGPNRFRVSREDMTMKRIALTQEWVSPRKRQLASAAATAMVSREAGMAASAAAQVRLQTALAYLDAYYAAQALQLNLRSESHAIEAAETARKSLAAGARSAPDALMLTSEQGMAADEAQETRQQVAAASANLARWTGVAGDELAPPVLPPVPDEQAFVDSDAMVVTKRREVELARAEAALTAANRSPNWSWQVAYGQRANAFDTVSVMVSVPLPVARAERQDRETAAKLALVTKAEAELEEATRAARGEYQMLASDAKRLAQRISDFQTAVLVPAQQRTQAAVAAYAASMGSLPMAFEARHAELEANRKLLTLQRELARVQAQLAFKPVTTEDLK